MAAMGIGSPVVTLFEFVSGASNCVDLFSDYRRSKGEIGHVAERIDSLTARINQIEVLERWIVERLVTWSADSGLETLSTSLCAAKQEFILARAFCKKCEQDQRSEFKQLRWARKGGKYREWVKIVARLQEAESSFRSTLQLLDW